MSLAICACVTKQNGSIISSLLKQHLKKPVEHLFVGETANDFVEAKKMNIPLALLVATTTHDIIEFLCDDYGLPDRRVKFIYTHFAGVDGFRFNEIEKYISGIPIYNAHGCFARILSEHVLFAMMYFNRQCWRMNASKALRKWDRFNMVELHGQNVCIVGYGNIGQCCGRVAVQMGMNVTGIRRTQPKEKVDENGVHLKPESELQSAVHEADFVVGVLPSTPKSQHFFNKEFFKLMKPSAIFINIGRGLTQCDADVAEAIKNGTIRAAALDVCEEEPLGESSPLWELPDDKLLLSAHCADLKEDFLLTPTLRFISIFERAVANEPINEHLVDIHKGY